MLLFRVFFCPGLRLSGHIQAGGCFVHFHYIYMSFFFWGEWILLYLYMCFISHSWYSLENNTGLCSRGQHFFCVTLHNTEAPMSSLVDVWAAAFRVIWKLLGFFQQQLNRGNVFFKKLRKWEATFVTALLQEKGKKKTINLSTFYLVSGSQVPRLQNVSNLNRASRHFQPPPRSNKQNTNKCVSEFFPFEMWKKKGGSVRTWNGSEHF